MSTRPSAIERPDSRRLAAAIEAAAESGALFRADRSRQLGPRDFDAQERFDVLADDLEAATFGLSSTRRAMSHPAFTEILALGSPAVTGALRRLKSSSNRPLWLRVLGTLTPFPPGAGQGDIDGAVVAWLAW